MRGKQVHIRTPGVAVTQSLSACQPVRRNPAVQRRQASRRVNQAAYQNETQRPSRRAPLPRHASKTEFDLLPGCPVAQSDSQTAALHSPGHPLITICGQKDQVDEAVRRRPCTPHRHTHNCDAPASAGAFVSGQPSVVGGGRERWREGQP